MLRRRSISACRTVLPIGDLPAILREHVVDEVIFAVGSESLAELEEVFLMCDEEGVRTRVAVDFFRTSTVRCPSTGSETPRY